MNGFKKQVEFLSWEYGMFFHFGIRSFYPGHVDWDNKDMPPEKFNPTELDCEQWIRVAKEAGATYAILTTKHHDGFALWPSKYSNYSVAQTPWKEGTGDVVREFVDACRKYDLKVGLYYSPAQWGKYSIPFDNEKAYDDYFINQLGELLTNYGKIDVLWYDVACPLHNFESWDSVNRNARLRKLQPHIIINDRSSLPEDFDTPEQSIRASTRDWEACNTLTRLAWGYVDEEQSKPFAISSKQILRDLHLCTCGGGNLLLNISPAPDGSVTKDTWERLVPVGDWLKINGEATYGQKFRTGPVYSANTLTAVSADKECKNFYLWNWVWPKNGKLFFGGYMDAPKKISYLATDEEIKFRIDGHRIILEDLPAEVPDKITGVTVLKMEFESAPRHVFRSYYPQIHQGTDFSEGYHKW